jgi:hypothetical protein
MRHGIFARSRVVVAALVALAMVVLGAVGVSGVAGAAGQGDRPAGPDPDSPYWRVAIEDARARLAASEAARNTPVAEGQREASLTAYRGLSASAALALARAEFPEMLSAPVWTGPVLAEGQRVVRYLGENEAQLSGPDGKGAVVTSTLALRGKRRNGERAPVDLRLEDVGGGFAPRSALNRVEIPARSDGVLRMSDRGFGVRLASVEGRDGQLSDDRVFFANVAEDTDALMTSHPGGAEVGWVLRSPASAQAQRLSFDLPAGGSLRLNSAKLGMGEQGTVDVLNGNHKLATIQPPAAWDAQGRDVAVSYELEGSDRLVVRVEHRGEKVAYPVMVDPVVSYYWNVWTWPTASNSNGTLTASNFNGYAQWQALPYVYNYPFGTWGAWFLHSATGSWQYAQYLRYLYHFPNNSLEYSSIQRDTPNAAEGGVWVDSNPPASGATAGRMRGESQSNNTTFECAGVYQGGTSCLRPAPGTLDRNYAQQGLFMLGPDSAGQPIPTTRVGIADVYGGDDIIPTLDPLSHSGLPGGWVQSFSASVGLTGRVTTGLGMGTVSISGPGVSQSSTGPCSGLPCPFTHSNTFSYNSGSMPTGINTIRGKATNVAGNQSAERTWKVHVDKTKPVVAKSGPLWTSPAMLPGQYTLNVNATDGVLGGADNQRQSGVESIRVFLEGPSYPGPTPTKVKEETQTTADWKDCGFQQQDSCPLSTSYTLDTTNLQPGQYTLSVETNDFVNNLQAGPDETRQFTVIATQSAVSQVQQLVNETIGVGGDWSSTCTAGVVADGYSGGTYLKMRAQPAGDGTPDRTWVCYRASNPQAGDFGGRIDIDGPSASPSLPSVDDNYETCSTTSGNAVPPPHPLIAGALLGNPFMVDTYSSSGASWVCVQIADGVGKRVLVPVSGTTAPAVTSHVDDPKPALPDPTPNPNPSGTCQTGGGSQVANMDGGSVHVWAYTWQPSTSRVAVCARAQGPASGGGMLEVDATGSPGVNPQANTDTNLAPCNQPVFDLTSPVDAHVSVGLPTTGSPVASVCVKQGSTQRRVFVGTSGSPVPPRVTWTPDPGTP